MGYAARNAHALRMVVVSVLRPLPLLHTHSTAWRTGRSKVTASRDVQCVRSLYCRTYVTLVLCVLSTAHSDSVWGVAWTRNEAQDEELILSGSVDNTVKVWTW